MKYIFPLLFAAVLMISCNDDKKALPVIDEDIASRHNAAFDSLLSNYNEGLLKLNPLNATALGDARYNDTLPNFLSDRYKLQFKNFYEDFQRQIKNYKENTMSVDQIISKRILEWECEMNLKSLSFSTDLTPINQFSTLQMTIGQMASGAGSQPFKTKKDYENWLKRLNNYVAWLNTAQEKMVKGVAEKYVLPTSLILKLSPQLKELTQTDVEKHLFYSPILNFPAEISAADRNELTKEYDSIISTQIIPAYTKLYDYVSKDYLKAGRKSSGIAAVPAGKALYDFYIKLYTTTDKTADEIHELGLSEVKRISKEMDSIKKAVGFNGTLKEFFNEVRTKKELMPYQDPKGVIANFHSIHEKMLPKLEKLFDLKPTTKFEVRRTEKFREASASAEYNPGSLDGTRPGVFFVPIPDVAAYNTFSDESLFLHEAIPGHHYQISLQQENDSLPAFRKNLWYSGYGEGWALYCESLGKELGLYEDPYQYFGMLSAEMHRAIRLVVDTGIHSKGWSREQAIKYSMENEARSEAGIIAEIERYMAIPGQALSYKIGQLKILELRKRAKKELGNKFNIAEFHNQILESGCLPLALLEEKINSWIKAYE